MADLAPVTGKEHWTSKGDVRLFLFEKFAGQQKGPRGTILFVHGSTMAGLPTFDFRMPGHPELSVMDHFARAGFSTWSVDMEGYGLSDKKRDINCDIATGADDVKAAANYIQAQGHGPLYLYGISSGALRSALFTQRNPKMVKRLALDAMVWTGEGSPTLHDRRKKLPEYQSKNRRPLDKAFMRSIFERDHPGSADPKIIDVFADQVLAQDTSVPTGTYVDMCTKLPIVDPEKIPCPTIIMRGQWDGIASFEDLAKFFAKLPNSDKQFAVMPGISHASFQQKNYALVYHILMSFFTQPEPIYTGH